MTTDLSNNLVFVTGYQGFLGSRLVDLLTANGANVIGLKFHGYPNEIDHDSSIDQEKFYLRRIDEDLSDLLEGPAHRGYKKTCYHFAGLASPLDCQRHPEEAYKSNVLLTQTVIEFCHSSHIDKLIYPSTGYVYGNQLKSSATENESLKADTVYTSTKLTAESLIQSYATEHELSYLIGRISNVYGNGISTETVTGKIIGCLNNDRPVVMNSLRPTRDFIYVDDVIRAFLSFLLLSPREAGIYNIGTGIPTSIKELAESACEVASVPVSTISSINGDETSDTWLVLDSSKLQNVSDWKPRISLEEGLAKVIKRP